jgi:hypothetical protein
VDRGGFGLAQAHLVDRRRAIERISQTIERSQVAHAEPDEVRSLSIELAANEIACEDDVQPVAIARAWARRIGKRARLIRPPVRCAASRCLSAGAGTAMHACRKRGGSKDCERSKPLAKRSQRRRPRATIHGAASQ